jgi:hypothetical protein
MNAPIYLSPTFGLVLIAIIGLIVILITVKKTQKIIFDERLEMLRSVVRESPVTKGNHDLIDDLFKEVNPHGEIQHEKKKRLWGEFQFKFEKVSKYKV